MTPASARVVIAGLGVLLAACRPTCDEAALERAIAELQANPDTEQSISDSLAALETACPSLPRGITASLWLDFAMSDPPAVFLRQDDSFQAEWRETCANHFLWAATFRGLPVGERGQATFAICELDRFGLLAPEEPPSEAELAAFVTYDWLVRNGVDVDLARRFVRGMMSVSAPEPVVLRRCEGRGGSACVSILRWHGGVLPSSSADRHDHDGVLVVVSRDSIRMVGEAPTMLVRGLVPSSNLSNHRIISLQDAMLRRAESERASAEARGEHWPDTLRIVADRDIPITTLIATLRTANQAGFVESSLLVEHDAWLTTLRIVPPPDEDDAHRAILVIEGDRVLLGPGPDGASRSVTLGDTEALEAAAGAMMREQPLDRTLTLRVEDDVPLHAVVSTLDALRGDCSLEAERLDESAKRCRFSFVSMELFAPPEDRSG